MAEASREAYSRLRANDPLMHLIDEWLADLPPLSGWQQAYLDATFGGQTMAFVGGRKSGRTFFQREVDAALQRAQEQGARSLGSPRADQVIIDEATDWGRRHISTTCKPLDLLDLCCRVVSRD